MVFLSMILYSVTEQHILLYAVASCVVFMLFAVRSCEAEASVVSYNYSLIIINVVVIFR